MAILLTARALSHAFSQRPLFQGISFTVSESERIGLIGPNGAGKSTLLKILAGQLQPDGGELAQKTGLRVGYLAQSPAFEPEAHRAQRGDDRTDTIQAARTGKRRRASTRCSPSCS